MLGNLLCSMLLAYAWPAAPPPGPARRMPTEVVGWEGDAPQGISCTLLDGTLRETAEDGNEVLGQKRLLQESGDPGA